jgi:hypothetical protein
MIGCRCSGNSKDGRALIAFNLFAWFKDVYSSLRDPCPHKSKYTIFIRLIG